MIKMENNEIDKMVEEFGQFTMGPEASLIENVQSMSDTYGNGNPWAAASPVYDKKNIMKRNNMRMKLDDLMLKFPSSREVFTNGEIKYQTLPHVGYHNCHYSVTYMSCEECSYEKFTDNEKLSYMNIGKILGVEPTINTLNTDVLKVMKCDYIISEVAHVKRGLLTTINADNTDKFLSNDDCDYNCAWPRIRGNNYSTEEFRPSDGAHKRLVSDVRKSAILVAQTYASEDAINDSYYKYAHRFDINIDSIDDGSLCNEKLEELLFDIIISLTHIDDFNSKMFYSILTKYIRLTNMMILRNLYSEMWAMIGLILLPNEIKHI